MMLYFLFTNINIQDAFSLAVQSKQHEVYEVLKSNGETILADVTASRTNKKRMVEINNYYNDSYRDLNNLLFVFGIIYY